MDNVRTNLPAQGQVHATRRNVLDVHREYWFDEWGIIHIIREHNTGYTMCHRWIPMVMSVTGYTEKAPNCLWCLTIER